jgi:predicted ATPase
VGRAAEWARLSSGWEKANAGNAQVVLITGEAGIGKTKLAQEFLQWCEVRGGVALTAYCPQAQEPLGYLAITNWLSSSKLAARLDRLGADELALLATLVPALRRQRPEVLPSPTLDGSWQRLHLYQALNALLVVSDETTILFLDDAQWCDGQSLEWLQSMVAAQAHTRLLVILSVRSGGSEAQSLTSAKTEMTMRGRLTQIILPRLTGDETRSLATMLADGDLPDDVVDRLHAASNGNPFFVVELVRMLKSAPLSPDGGRRDVVLALPESIAAIIEHHLALLSQPARHVLDIGASIGKNFSIALLARIDKLSDETRILALDELVRFDLIRPVDEYVLGFSHELIHEVVCAQLGELRRRHLRQLITQAVADLYGDKAPA